VTHKQLKVSYFCELVSCSVRCSV